MKNQFNILNCDNYKVIDHTHTLSPENPGYLEDDTIKIIPNKDTTSNDIIEFKIILSEHFGTHIDAPIHFGEKNSIAINQIPPENLVGPVVVIDVRNKVEKDSDYELSLNDINNWEKMHGYIPDNAIVIMFSGWQDRWNKPDFYRNKHDNTYHFPGFSLSATNWMLNNRNINGIGIDTLSVDNGLSKNFFVHQTLFNAQKWCVENLCNLEKIPPIGGFMVVGPIKHEGGSGGPARIYTILPC